MEQKIRVLIVDDHPVVREGFRTMLSADQGIEVVAEASDGLEAVAATAEKEPDVVLMDIRMPNLDGIEATRRIKAQRPSTAVVMLSIYDDDAYVVDAVQAGASGYLLKDASRDLLTHTIRVVNSGGTLVKTSLLYEAICSLVGSAVRRGSAGSFAATGLEQLTPREQEVLQLVANGGTNRGIAAELSITEDTVKKHVQNIISKLGACDRTEAATKAVRAGLVK